MLSRSNDNKSEAVEVEREIEGERFPEEHFVMPVESPVALASVRPVHQELAKRLTDGTSAPPVGDAILTLSQADENRFVITVWTVAEEAHILEISTEEETVYFETTSNELKHELQGTLRTREWSVQLLDDDLTESLLDGI